MLVRRVSIAIMSHGYREREPLDIRSLSTSSVVNSVDDEQAIMMDDLKIAGLVGSIATQLFSGWRVKVSSEVGCVNARENFCFWSFAKEILSGSHSLVVTYGV